MVVLLLLRLYLEVLAGADPQRLAAHLREIERQAYALKQDESTAVLRATPSCKALANSLGASKAVGPTAVREMAIAHFLNIVPRDTDV